MILFGTKGRESDVDRGEFHCPRCDRRRPYVRKRAGNYFTLYFVPLFQVQDLGEFVECGTCGARFETTVLLNRPPSERDRLVAAVRADLDSGTPLRMAAQKLVNSGMSQDAADSLVAQAAGPSPTECPQCRFRYSPAVRKCSQCGTAL